MSKCVRCGNELLTGDIHYEMGLCNKCYNELYKDHKSHISLDKMWLEIANNFRNDNEKLQERISELEAKLAESNESHHKNIVELTKMSTEKDRKIEELKQQLAESEKQVEFYKEENKINKEDCDYYFNEYTLCKQKIKNLKQENSELHTAINMSIPNQIAMRGEINRLHTCIDDRIAELVEETNQLKQQLAEKDDALETHKRVIQRMNRNCDTTMCRNKIDFAVEQLSKIRNFVNGQELFSKYKCESKVCRDILQAIDNQIKQLKEGK